MSDEAAESVESKRINEIMTLKREVFDVKDELDRAEMVGRAPGKAPELYQRKVRDYVISLEPVLNPAGEDPSPYWDRVDIGAFELPNGEQKEVTEIKQLIEQDDEMLSQPDPQVNGHHE